MVFTSYVSIELLEIIFDCPGVDHGRAAEGSTVHEYRERVVKNPAQCDQCGVLYENKVFHCAHCGIRAHKDCLNFIPSTCGMAGDQLRGTLRITVKHEEAIILSFH